MEFRHKLKELVIFVSSQTPTCKDIDILHSIHQKTQMVGRKNISENFSLFNEGFFIESRGYTNGKFKENWNFNHQNKILIHWCHFENSYASIWFHNVHHVEKLQIQIQVICNILTLRIITTLNLNVIICPAVLPWARHQSVIHSYVLDSGFTAILTSWAFRFYFVIIIESNASWMTGV